MLIKTDTICMGTDEEWNYLVSWGIYMEDGKPEFHFFFWLTDVYAGSPHIVMDDFGRMMGFNDAVDFFQNSKYSDDVLGWINKDFVPLKKRPSNMKVFMDKYIEGVKATDPEKFFQELLYGTPQ